VTSLSPPALVGGGVAEGLCRRATAGADMAKSVGDRLGEGLGTIRAYALDAGSCPSPPTAHIHPEQGSLNALPPPLLIKLGYMHHKAVNVRS